MSLTSSMNIAQQALSVAQAAITVTSNNIANVDTDGYSKLRVNLASVVYNASSVNAYAEANSLSGVEISNIERYTDAATQSHYWQQNSTNSYLSESSTIASNVEDVMNELNDTGLSKALNTFYTAANTLSSNPSDITARQSYVSAAENVCTVFNTVASTLTNMQTSLAGSANDTTALTTSTLANQTDSVNSLLEQIATVNGNIVTSKNGSTTSTTLLDQRDALITKLTALIPISTQTNENETVNISLGNYNLVKGSTVAGELNVSYQDTDNNAATPNTLTVDIVDPKDSTNVLHANVGSLIDGGSVGAILDVAGSSSSEFNITGVLSELNTMASTFASTLNTIQTGAETTTTNGVSTTTYAMCLTSDGKALQSSAGYAMFKSNDTTNATITAGNISVNSDIVNNPYYVAAARTTGTTDPSTGVVTPTDSKATGNNSNVTEIIAARTKTSTTLGGTTVEGYLANVVNEIGSSASNINASLASQKTVLSQIETNLKSSTGVNLDEELTEMLKYQRAYEAAARIFTTCSNLTDELVKLGQ